MSIHDFFTVSPWQATIQCNSMWRGGRVGVVGKWQGSPGAGGVGGVCPERQGGGGEDGCLCEGESRDAQDDCIAWLEFLSQVYSKQVNVLNC